MKCWLAYRAFFAYMLLFACVFALMGKTAFASHSQKETERSDAQEVSSEIEDATVNLYCRLTAGKKIYSASGSGVFVSDRGVILTNAHVAQFFLLAQKNKGGKEREKGKVTGKCSVRTGSPAKERYTVSVLYFPSIWAEENASEIKKKSPKGTGENDFALLYVTDAKKGKLPEVFPALPVDLAIDTVGSTAAQGAITVAGYPTEKLDFDGIRKKLSVLTASSTVTNTRGFRRNQSTDVLTIAPSAAGSLGVSGGPVVDSSGKVVGIVTAKSTAKGDRTIRAITLAYIDRALRAQTTFPLHSFLSTDPATQAGSTGATVSLKTIEIISSGLLEKK